MRILVTGKQGQVVQALLQRGQKAENVIGVEVLTIGRSEMDMADPAQTLDAIRASIAAFKPDLIVNAAAYTTVDQAEDEPDLAFAINAASAGAIAQASAEAGLPIIQISTDYVFDGTKDGAYTETDTPNPQGVYGASKRAGEEAVRAANPQHIILRTAWVYSPFGKNFVKTMLRLAETRDELSIVADQFGNPTSAFDIADGILTAAGAIEANSATVLWGTYNLAGTGAINWAGFAEEIFKLSTARGGPDATVKHITTAEYPTKAKRPANSQLDCAAFEIAFGWRARDWQAALEETMEVLLPQKPTEVSVEQIIAAEPILEPSSSGITLETYPAEIVAEMVIEGDSATAEPINSEPVFEAVDAVQPAIAPAQPNTNTQANPQKRTCIMVLGMHRSGTSCTAGILSLLGIGMPKNMQFGKNDNPKGHFESIPINICNDQLLLQSNATWKSLRNIRINYETDSYLRWFDQTKNIFEAEFEGKNTFVFKDPRVCRLLKPWLEILEGTNTKAKIIFVFRSPLDVARSLDKRDNISITHGILLWLQHVIEAEFLTRHLERTFVNWSSLLADWKSAIVNISKELNLQGILPSLTATHSINSFVDHNLTSIDHNETFISTEEKTDIILTAEKVFDLFCNLQGNQYSDIMIYLDQTRLEITRAIGLLEPLTDFYESQILKLDTAIYMEQIVRKKLADEEKRGAALIDSINNALNNYT